MNQTDLIQKIMATEHQAKALAETAIKEKESIEAGIDDEIAEIRVRYAKYADAYLSELAQNEKIKSQESLDALDHRLRAKLDQVESIYETLKGEWVDAIFYRIVGKAGG